ncbi:MAG: 30S ribosomal protein S1 [Candidatus Palauibacterales bacterium]|nr:30S ribosomal protein S1 [Candidatus Palauibacterales bacterium]
MTQSNQEAGNPAVEAVKEEQDIPVVDTTEMEPGQGEEVELTHDQITDRAHEVGIRPDLFDEEDYSLDEYEEMLAMYEDTLGDITEGEIVDAEVLRKTENAVILDVGFKSEGRVDLEEFREPDEIEIGQTVEVFLESLEDEEGQIVLSKKKADFLKVWEKLKASYESEDPVEGTLSRRIKGGAMVDIMGVEAFLPGSQIALRRVPNIEDLVGNTYQFRILKLNKRRRNIVVSRRVLLEEERAKKREQLKEELEVGQVRTGTVKNITDFGAFIDLGGMDGLCHITDMSWGRVDDPTEVCEIGDEIDVKVLDIDWERERISLGLKQLQSHPWEDVAEKYPVGSRVKGKVVSITNYGAFVELEKGVEGLVHISEMSWTRNIRHPSQLVSIGEEIECVVLRVDEDDEKISLGIKQTEEDPWLSLPAKYPPGTNIEGTVRNLTSFGAFVEVEPGIDGLVHISDMSWTRRVQHPSEVVRKGEEIEVVVLNIDPEKKRISLGLKQTQEDPWYELAQKYNPGRTVTGQVVRMLDKGIVVDLGNEVEGFCPISELGVGEEVEHPSDHFVEGDDLLLKVMESDPINRRIVLSVEGGEEAAEEFEESGDEAAAAAVEEEAAAAAEAEEPEAEAETEDVEAEAGEDEAAEEATEPEPESEPQVEVDTSDAGTLGAELKQAMAEAEAKKATEAAEAEAEEEAEEAEDAETAEEEPEDEPEASAESGEAEEAEEAGEAEDEDEEEKEGDS